MTRNSWLRCLGNILAVSAVCLPLSGCFVPPVVSLAALVFDAGSFATTGKTAKDHGISLIAQEDCALLRVFDGEVCRPYNDMEEAPELAVLRPLEPEGELIVDLPFDPNNAPILQQAGILATLDYVPADAGVAPGAMGPVHEARIIERKNSPAVQTALLSNARARFTDAASMDGPVSDN